MEPGLEKGGLKKGEVRCGLSGDIVRRHTTHFTSADLGPAYYLQRNCYEHHVEKGLVGKTNDIEKRYS
jgi:hypothetical protein